MEKVFKHLTQRLKSDKPLVYTAMSKRLFYSRMFVSKYVLEQNAVPLNPFMVFDYFLLDSVDRDLVRQGNNNLVKRSDEIWVFGSVSNGVLAEIELARKMNKPVKYFQISDKQDITQVNINEVELEEDIKEFRNKL